MQFFIIKTPLVIFILLNRTQKGGVFFVIITTFLNKENLIKMTARKGKQLAEVKNLELKLSKKHSCVKLWG